MYVYVSLYAIEYTYFYILVHIIDKFTYKPKPIDMEDSV